MQLQSQIFSDQKSLYYAMSESYTDPKTKVRYVALLDDEGQTVIGKTHPSDPNKMHFVRQGVVNFLTRRRLGLKVPDGSTGISKFSFVEANGKIVVMPTLEAAAPKEWDNRTNARREGLQFHHITPKSLSDHVIFSLAGMEFENTWNQMLLPTHVEFQPTRQVHNWNHTQEYTKHINDSLQSILFDGAREGWTRAQYKDALQTFLGEEKKSLRHIVRGLNRSYRPPEQ